MEIQTHASTGYYAFHDYAAAFWWHHIDKIIESPNTLHQEPFRSIFQSAAKVLKMYAKTTSLTLEQLESLDMIMGKFFQLPRSARERQMKLGTDTSTERVRTVIEGLRPGENRVRDSMVSPLYGALGYKCPKSWCQMFQSCFPTAKQRDDHINEHERPFRCSTEGCFVTEVGFPTKTGLNLHIKIHHAKPDAPLFPSSAHVGTTATSIWAAIMKGDLESVKALIESDKSLLNKVRKTAVGLQIPLLLASQLGHVDICEYLLGAGADIGLKNLFKEENLLHLAVQRGDLAMTNLLLEQKNPQFDFQQRVLSVLEFKLLASFMRKGPPGNFNTAPCMIQAVQRNQVGTVQALLKLTKGTISIPLSHDLMRALEACSSEILTLLNSIDLWEYDGGSGTQCTILHVACCWDGLYIHLARRLIALDRSSSRNRLDHMGCTAIDVAVKKGSYTHALALLCIME